MRRRHDDWINATHILKAAGFDKPARTRILEREVQKDVHEKIQGGYGKYQGTHLRRVLLDISSYMQVLGSLLRLAKRLPTATGSTKNSQQYSHSSREMTALLRLRSILPTSQRSQ